MEKIEALKMKIDSQFKEIKREMKEMQDRCNSCGGPHPSSECDDKPMGGPKDEEANYVYRGYRGGGYQGNYYDRILKIGAIINHEMTTETPNLVKTTLPFQQLPKRNSKSLTLKKPCESSWNLDQRLPLVDVLVGMPNYEKFLKDVVSNESKMEQISAAFLNEECSAIIQNKLPPKLGDPGSFLILYTLANLVECLALADLGASINLMAYSLYASLFENNLKPKRMGIRLANIIYNTIGVAENMLVQVGKFVFPIDFVILLMEEDDKVPLILGRPFLHIADAIIRVKNKELNLGGERIVQLLDDYEPFLSTSEKINETSLDKEFEVFMAVDVEEIPKQ
ncbi:reverse transcriptase domain-containing protein [Tanacetum coccineum]